MVQDLGGRDRRIFGVYQEPTTRHYQRARLVMPKVPRFSEMTDPHHLSIGDHGNLFLTMTPQVSAFGNISLDDTTYVGEDEGVPDDDLFA